MSVCVCVGGGGGGVGGRGDSDCVKHRKGGPTETSSNRNQPASKLR